MNHIKIITRSLAAALTAAFFCLITVSTALSAPLIPSPPLGERWFGISVDTDQVGFYRQKISALPDGGYRIEGNGSVRMRVMSFTKEASSREVYLTDSALALKSFEVEQTISGSSSRLSGRITQGGILVKRDAANKVTEKLLKAKGEIIPAPALNFYPLLRDSTKGKVFKVLTFDPEEIKIKEVKITFLGEENTPDGQQAIKLRNNLYPFVDNDIWLDHQGNTILESVREGLVVTRAEQPEKLAAVVSGVALSKKDLIFDFSMVRAEPSIKQPVATLKGISVAIEGYGEKTPLIDTATQQNERTTGTLLIRTGTLRTSQAAASIKPDSSYLAAVPGIEADSPAIVAKSKELTAGKQGTIEQTKALSAWTAQWLKDTIDDSGTALQALTAGSGNCQSHSKLYTALARAAGIPTRFVSGLVSRDGKGFLYHSWAESWIDEQWLAIDPTFDQWPADPAHLAFFEGHTATDLSPLVTIIGKIRLKILEER